MALTKSFTFKGIDLPTAYFKIVRSQIDHLAKTGHIMVNIYESKKARQDGPVENAVSQIVLIINAENYEEFIEDALGELLTAEYLFAKTCKDQGTDLSGAKDA